ncbi:SMI1/KNR4 family protein [Streptomyces sp. UNOC14_S4]|uniref:SMI1/KNR4 family protein n=1 Tax=Streptomyces sp. UNOC14_S4 TaxID=2872340 RepID=UPI001E62CC1D|nr:SMI1/KNR4 family protein [Streptomyces sp. UNOC14_S4]
MATTVDIPPYIQERCNELGGGVSYALKVLRAQLGDDPLMGTPQGDPSLYTVDIDGDTFEDCPALLVHYAYGPPLLEEGRVEIRGITATQAPATGNDDQDQVPDRGLEEAAVRQVTAAWRRIEAWLREHAPASYASLKAGASVEEISALEGTLGLRVPADLKALWSLHAGVRDVRGAGFLPDNRALMDLEAVAAFHRMQMMFQQRSRSDEDPTWRPSWIPFCSYGVDDRSSGLYLDSATGELGYFSRYAERWTEYASLTVYLEEFADALEAPGLVTGARPGLTGGALVWGPPNYPNPDHPWVEYTG